MLKVVIIDDEAVLRKGLINKLNRIFPGQIDVIAQAGSVSEGKVILKATSPDLVFLDIQLSDGLSLEIFNEDFPINFQIIFITAFNQYAINAIKLGALDYLLKPLDDDELEKSMQKYFSNAEKDKFLKERLELTKHELHGSKENKIVLRTSTEYHLVYFDNIMFCESDAGYTTFYLKDGSKVLVSKSLKEYEMVLPGSIFARTHQSYLVNVSEVSKYDKDGYLILHSKHKVPVSIRKKDEILERLFN
jgi:two-component system, LytTR family, response regulator